MEQVFIPETGHGDFGQEPDSRLGADIAEPLQNQSSLQRQQPGECGAFKYLDITVFFTISQNSRGQERARSRRPG
jgi:hypothetical protein